jgi:hypothetical protein
VAIHEFCLGHRVGPGRTAPDRRVRSNRHSPDGTPARKLDPYRSARRALARVDRGVVPTAGTSRVLLSVAGAWLACAQQPIDLSPCRRFGFARPLRDSSLWVHHDAILRKIRPLALGESTQSVGRASWSTIRCVGNTIPGGPLTRAHRDAVPSEGVAQDPSGTGPRSRCLPWRPPPSHTSRENDHAAPSLSEAATDQNKAGTPNWRTRSQSRTQVCSQPPKSCGQLAGNLR